MTAQNEPVVQNDEKKLELKDLKPGDILIFDTDDSLIDKLITRLTKSTVTHAALFVQNGETALLADAGGTGIDLHRLTSEGEIRGINIRRLTKEGGFGDEYEKAVAPVIDIAYDYVRQDLPYPYSDLVLLAMIIVFKDVSHCSLNSAYVIKLLQVAAAEIKTIIDNKYHDGKHTMVCSSYVYQCFLDASATNKDLKINIENGDVQPAKKQKRSATLFDLYVEHAAEYSVNAKRFTEAKLEPVTDSIDEILNNLIDKENQHHISLIKSNILSKAIEEFLKVLLKAAGCVAESITDLIENAKKQQSLFVTPNDLYCHTTNTESVGKVYLYRDGDEYKI